MVKILILALLLTVAPASAGNLYEYITVTIDVPKTCDSPCEIRWHLRMPENAIPLAPFVKKCPTGPQITTDRYITLYQDGANYPEGGVGYILGDNHPGRTQTYCLRAQYYRLID